MKHPLLEPFAMKKSCGDCAFDPQSDAGRCEATVTTATLCVLSGEPFYCHRSRDGVVVGPREDHNGEPVFCRGFVDAFTARGPVSDWQAAVADECLRVMEDAKDGKAVTPDELRARVLAAGNRSEQHG